MNARPAAASQPVSFTLPAADGYPLAAMRYSVHGAERGRLIMAGAADDLWAPPDSRDAFMRGYRNAPWFGIDVDPAKSGIGKIGHMGYFRPQAQSLWVAALDWFDGVGAQRPAAHPPV